MKWYSFSSRSAFDAWHQTVKTALGLPRESVDEHGQVVVGAVVTDAYTEAHTVSETDVRVFIPNTYADGLTVSEDPYPDER